MRQLTRRLCGGALLLLAVACAHIAPPPGGPPRFTPPVLLGTFPDSVRVLPDFRGRAVFQFDEVVSEGTTPNFGYGNGTLEALVLMSPDTVVPSVEWHRSRLSVRPRHGWKPNTVYRIELLPGLADLQLRPNLTKTSSVITFATGGAVPTRTLVGRVIDWSATRGAPGALVDAIHLPDSAGYRTLTDSSGYFTLGPLPDGSYLVECVIDLDHNHRRNGKEAWDTVRVAATRDSVGEIWVFTRDTLPPSVQGIARQDSTGIAITFADPIDPYQRIPADSIRVMLLPDSANVGPVSALPKSLDDSLHQATTKRSPAADSTARLDSLRRDSTARAEALRPKSRAERQAALHAVKPPEQKRPVLGSALVVRTTGTIQYGKRYYVEVRGVRSAGGVAGMIKRSFDVPKEVIDTAALHKKAHADSVARDSTRAKGDTTARGKSDSTRARTDTTTRGKPDSTARPRTDTTAARKPESEPLAQRT